MFSRTSSWTLLAKQFVQVPKKMTAKSHRNNNEHKLLTPRWVEVACNMLRLQPTGSNRLSSIVLVTKAAYYITINIVDWLTKYSQLTYREKENKTLSRNVFLLSPMNLMDFQIKDNKCYRAVTRCTSVLRRGSHSEPHEQKRYTARQKFKDLVECLLCLCTAETRLLLS